VRLQKKRKFLKNVLHKTNLPLQKYDELVIVLLYEQFFGRGISISNAADKKLQRFVSIIQKNADSIKYEIDSLSQNESSHDAAGSNKHLPRYVRINTLKTTFDHVKEFLSSSQWAISSIGKDISPDKYSSIISSQSLSQVFLDPHIENLLIFHHGVDIHGLELVVNGSLVLQDKASCLSAFVLNPRPGSHVIDACAAPGMKTTHLAQIMNNKGKIFAFDKCLERVNVLNQMLEKCDVAISQVQNADFLTINVNDKKFSKVEYIVVDPPCTGSGMVKRNEFFLNSEERVDKGRSKRLANLQAMILKHALKFPKLKRLVYSTCSTNIEENEGVVLEAMNDEDIFSNFELVDPLPSWKHRGIVKGEFKDVGNLCLRASYEEDLTNGFFVAVFQRR